MRNLHFLPPIRKNEVAAVGLALALLYYLSLSNYLLFHSLAEAFSIVIACGMFMLAWNARHFWHNNYLLFVGIAFLFVAGLDFLHLLAYQGMGVFPGSDANLPTQLWLGARYLQSLTLLVAPLFLRAKNNLRPAVLALSLAAITGLFLASVFAWQNFPVAYAPGTGLTPFKKVSEYAISGILLLGVLLLYRHRRAFTSDVALLLGWAMLAAIACELVFTLYTYVDDLRNLAGHVLKIVSFYLIYRALIETGLLRPYDLLFRDLKQARDELEIRVQQRTAELSQREAALSLSNAALEERTRKLRASQEQLRELSRRLVEVQENERRAIARELHDEAGQSLTSLKLGLGALSREQLAPEELTDRLETLKQMVDGVLEELHRLAVNLRPVSLDRLGLAPALEQYLTNFRSQTGLEVELLIHGLDRPGTKGNGQRLPPSVETALYRLVQEALTNVARHAHASQVGVVIECRDRMAIAIIEDNGAGFDVEAAAESGRLGLMGMRERMDALGGSLTIESTPDSGTVIYAHVPLAGASDPALGDGPDTASGADQKT